jgi:hypothetical protein
MSARKIQTWGNHPEQKIHHSEHSKSLMSGTITVICMSMCIFLDTEQGDKGSGPVTGYSVN